MIFVLGEKENPAIAALLMNFILKHKAKRGIFIGQISRQNGINLSIKIPGNDLPEIKTVVLKFSRNYRFFYCIKAVEYFIITISLIVF